MPDDRSYLVGHDGGQREQFGRQGDTQRNAGQVVQWEEVVRRDQEDGGCQRSEQSDGDEPSALGCGKALDGAVLTSWLLDALGLSASFAWRSLGSRPGHVARSCDGEVGLGLVGVGDADHRVGVRARGTSVVYQARGREGSAGVGCRARRRVGPTAPSTGPRLGTMTTSGEQPAVPDDGEAC
jgi:hypothetical protein